MKEKPCYGLLRDIANIWYKYQKVYTKQVYSGYVLKHVLKLQQIILAEEEANNEHEKVKQ